MPAQALEAGSNVERAKAMYDYVAATNEEVDLEQGDLIIVEFKVRLPRGKCYNARRAREALPFAVLNTLTRSRPCRCRLTTAGGLAPTPAPACLACFLAALSRLSRVE